MPGKVDKLKGRRRRALGEVKDRAGKLDEVLDEPQDDGGRGRING